MSESEIALLTIITLPLLAGIVSFAVDHANLREAGIITVAVVTLYKVSELLIQAHGQTWTIPQVDLVELVPGLSLGFSIEPLGMIFAMIVAILWLVTTIYAIGYMRGNHEGYQGRFFGFFAIAIFAAFGIAFASNLFTLFVFYEVLTLCTYPLVAHNGSDDAKRGARVYLGILLATSLLFLLPAVLMTWLYTGTVDFIHGGIVQGSVSDGMAAFLLALFVFGIGKAAIMPMHRWLPAAMVAPTPVSALLHAVAVVKAGVFSMIKVVVYIFGTDYLQELMSLGWAYGAWVVYLAGLSIVVASTVALMQDDLKKRLAYSTVSQLSYITMSVFVLAPISVTAAAFHIAAHAFAKITLFFAAGSIYTAAHKKKISQLSGIGRAMPITMVAFTIGALSMIGVPPTVGFISKWYMLEGAFQVEQFFVVGVLIVSTVLNASYFLPVVYKAFFEEPDKPITHKEAPLPILLAISFTALATCILFLVPDLFLDLANALKG